MFNLVRRSPFREISPFRELSRFEREADRFFRNFWNRAPMVWEEDTELITEPSINMFEEGDNIVVEAQVPGLKKDDLHLQITSDRLLLRGETKEESEKKDRNYHFREMRYGRFERAIPLPYEVSSDKAKAELKDGVLRVTLPKSEAARKNVREIEVKAA